MYPLDFLPNPTVVLCLCRPLLQFLQGFVVTLLLHNSELFCFGLLCIESSSPRHPPDVGPSLCSTNFTTSVLLGTTSSTTQQTGSSLDQLSRRGQFGYSPEQQQQQQLRNYGGKFSLMEFLSEYSGTLPPTPSYTPEDPLDLKSWLWWWCWCYAPTKRKTSV